MTNYISPPLETDPDQLTQDAFDYLSTNIPGWVPRDGHLEVWQIQAIMAKIANTQDIASAVFLSIFRTYGSTVMGFQPIDAIAATIPTTWTMVDNAGYTVFAGTQVAWAISGNEFVVYEVVADVVVAPGSVATPAGSVVLVAIEPGIAGNGNGPGAMTLLDPLAFVNSVVATSAATGGVDAESDDTYLARFKDDLELLTPRPILARDYAVLTRNVTGVHRATGIDNYNPLDNTDGNERMVAIAAVDVNGDAVDVPTKTAIAAYLEGMREVNFVVHVFNPTYTAVGVTFTFTVDPNANPTTVQGLAIQAVRDFLDKSTWGVDGNDTSKVSWTNATTVHFNDLISVLYAVPGLKSVPVLQINGVAADLVMAGRIALPTIGVISGTLA
jgi:hypothetical protein